MLSVELCIAVVVFIRKVYKEFSLDAILIIFLKIVCSGLFAIISQFLCS